MTNAANLSFFMVNVSHRLLRDFRVTNPLLSVLDLKATFLGYKYVEEIFKLLPQKPNPILFAYILTRVANLGAIHPIHEAKTPLSLAKVLIIIFYIVCFTEVNTFWDSEMSTCQRFCHTELD